MSKILSFQSNAREKLYKGVKLLADAVITTLGPKGRNVAIQRPWGIPIVVHDGVTVAREVDTKDPLVAIGIHLVREAASKTNEEAGDGTTTATLLAYEIIKRGLVLIEEGVNPMVLRNQIYEALPLLKDELDKMSKKIKSKQEIAQVATISAADPEVGKLVADAIDQVGKDGLVTVDESVSGDTEVEFTEGMEFDKGMLSPYFVTNPSRLEAVIEKPLIALIAQKLSLNTEIVPLVEFMAKTSKDIVIIAEDVSGDALATMAANKMKGNINAIAVAAPGIGDNKNNYLEDIAVLTGGKVVFNHTELDFSSPNASWLGKAERVVSSRETTVIIGGKGDKKEIDKHLANLRTLKDNEKSKFEKEKFEERLARASKGVGVIKVGAKTEIDMREKVERVKDAVGAASAARDEGVVSGGGTAFLLLSKALEGHTEGQKLLKEVLQAPTRRLMANSGEPTDEINRLVERILAAENPNFGYEVNSGEVKDLAEAGIIDPVKVVRLALENAIGVGTSILTTDALIGIVPEKNDKQR